MPRDVNGLRKLRWCTFKTALQAVFRHHQKDGGELLFTVAQLNTSVWGGDALPSPQRGGSGRRGRAAAADELGPAQLRAVPRPSAVPSGLPRHDSGRRSGHGRGRAAATERTASQSRTGTFGFPPRAGAPREPTRGPPSRAGGADTSLPSCPLPRGTPSAAGRAAASRQRERRKATWESRAGRTRGRSAAGRL